jgi:hypothetical protein
MVNAGNISRCTAPNCSGPMSCESCIAFYNFPAHNPNPVFLFSPTLELVYANQIAQNNVLNASNPFQLKAFYSKLKQSLESLINSDKVTTHFYFSTSVNSFRFDINYAEAEDCIYLFGVNITREMSLSDEINSQGDFLNRILDNVPVDITLFDTKHQYRYINKVAIKDDETRKWLIGKTDFDYCDYKAKDKALAEGRREIFKKVLSSKEDFDYVDKIKVENKTKYVLRRFHPVLTDGKVTEVIGYAVDITDQIQAQKKLHKTYDLLFDSQVHLKQTLGYYVHNVRHPMSNIEGLIENFNVDDPTDPANKIVIDGLVKSYNELRKSFDGFTNRLDNSFNTFQTEKNNIDIKASISKHAENAMQKYQLKYKLRFSSKNIGVICFYTFMYNRIFSQFFQFLAYTIDKSYVNVLVECTSCDALNAINLHISKVHLSKAAVAKINDAIKAIDAVDFDVNKNYLSDIACILTCNGGFLSFDYREECLSFSLNFPNLNINV